MPRGALEGVFVMLSYLVIDYIFDVGCGTRSVVYDDLCLHDIHIFPSIMHFLQCGFSTKDFMHMSSD